MAVPPPPSANTHRVEGQRIFSFGTLLDPNVQRHVFKRTLEMKNDALPNHSVTDVVIDESAAVRASGSPVHRRLARREGSTVEGAVVELNETELAAADAYEVSACARRRVLTSEHGQVWAYVDARPLVVAERVALLGDSIAYGRNDPAGGWAARIATIHHARNEARKRFFNLSIPGATVKEFLDARLPEAFARRVDTVIIAGGANDLVGKAVGSVDSVDEVLDDVAALCAAFEAKGVRPLVLGPIWNDEKRTRTEFGADLPNRLLFDLDRELNTWATETNRDFVSIWRTLEDRSEFLADGLHPSVEGHTRLAADLRVLTGM